MPSILLAAYTTVLVTELVGDRTLYTVSALASRYRAAAIAAGLAPAFMGKMAVAVALGGLIARLPGGLLTAVTALSFIAAAAAVWRSRPEPAPALEPGRGSWPRGAAVAFSSTFFSEWGDIGMVTAATLSARFHAPAVVWAAATAALLTKGALALALGVGLRRYLPRHVLRYAAVAVCVGMAVLVVVRPER